MPVTVAHSLTATTPDNTSYEIRPSHWNEAHVATISLSNNEVIKWVSAGTNSISSGTLVFSNSNNVTFGMATNGVVTASVPAGAADGVNVIAAGTQTANTTGTVLFQNSNGITFGLSNSSIVTASHNGLTTAMASNRGSDFVQATAAFAGTSASGTIASNGISISIGPYITTAMLSNAATISNIKLSAGTLSANRSDMTFGNSNGISFGLQTNGVITGTVATNYQSQGAYLTTAALSDHSHGNPTLALTNISGTTESNSAGLTLSLSAAAPGAGGGIAAAAGTQTATSGTVLFNNSNGVTFGMSNSSLITASHNGLTTAALSDHSHGNPTLALTNLSGTTASASNGFTLSLSAAAPGGGGGISQRWFADAPFPPIMALLTNITGITSRQILLPFHIDGSLTASELMWQMSRATTGSNNFSMHIGVYTFVNNTQISLLGSNSHSFSNTATASNSGVRQFEVSCGTNFSTLGPGDYVLGIKFDATATASANYSIMGNSTANPAIGVLQAGADLYVTATSHHYIPFWGRCTVNSASLFNSIAASDVNGIFSGASLPLPIWFNLGRD